ncbi:phage holin [Exiguobacterium undae]|uniref:Holin n=1 Tax=Exiguobacterium undae TaxID=169177 RepID=A0ABX2VBH8_9BACL|nr:phage holin [Exiguobacterium undae]OAN15588.1 holin [Exiguobacterium undae]
MKSRRTALLRLVVPLYSLLNLTLLAFGYDPLPFETTEVETALTALVGAMTLIYAWWKNNNLTQAAARAQHYLVQLKDQKDVENQTRTN